MKARELGRRSVVVGDRVALVGDVSGDAGPLARIVRVEPRTLDAAPHRRRHRPGRAGHRRQRRPARRSSPRWPTREPRPRLIDRCLVAAYDAGLRPLLCLTKADLASPEALLEAYGALDVPSRRHPAARTPLDALREHLRGRVSVLVGHSGVGKSTLVNALVPGADRATGGVNAVTGRGRHIVVVRGRPRLPGGGWVIDTPGLRSFGLAHVDLDRIIHAFPDLAAARPTARAACTPRRAGVRAGRLGRGGAQPTRPGWRRCAGCCAAGTRPRTS